MFLSDKTDRTTETDSEAGRARNQVIQRHSTISARSCRTPWECQKSYVTLVEISGGAAAAKRANRGGQRTQKTEGAGQPDGPQNRQRGGSDDPQREPRAPGPDHRQQSRGPNQGEGEGQGPKAQGDGAAKERPQSRGPNNPHRPPGAAAPRSRPRRPAVRKKDGGPLRATGQAAVQ